MNWKRLIPGLGAVLVCTSLIAFGIQPPKLVGSASDASSLQTEARPTSTTTTATVVPKPTDLTAVHDKLANPTGLQATPLACGTRTGGRGEPPENDECTNAELVTGPYPVTVCGSNVGATMDCPGVLNWEAVWYEIELPYEVNNLTVDYCPTETDMLYDLVGVIRYDDCSDCSDYIMSFYDWHDCPNGNYNPIMEWTEIPGPTTVILPVYIDPAHDFCIEVDVEDTGPCDLVCPPGGVYEAEACGEDTNGGCSMDSPAFEQLTCGVPVLGTGWLESGYRDTDWYEVTVTEPTILTWTVEAEFEILTGLIAMTTPGVADCSLATGDVDPYALGTSCDEVTVEYRALAGTYWWFVGAQNCIVHCGELNEYLATMTCEPWDLRGACCDDATGECTDDVAFEDCPEPMRFTQETLCADINPPCGGCPESTLEIEILTDNYPLDTTWTVTDHVTGDVMFSGGSYTALNMTYLETCCIGADDCVDFTIYDSYGDGIDAPGGFAIRLNEALIWSTLGSGWLGTEASWTYIGPCEGPTGACCVHPDCIATVTAEECEWYLGGTWYEGEDCDSGYVCPDIPCDFAVEAPYTSPLRSTCGAIDDCSPQSQGVDTEDHTYCVTIPHDGTWSINTCLDSSSDTWLAIGTTLCGQQIGVADKGCGEVGAQQSSLTTYLTARTYYVTVEMDNAGDCGDYILDIHEIICPECPEGADQEPEACGEDVNGGCVGEVEEPLATPIALNQTYCGTGWYDGNVSGERDNDIYVFVAPADDTVTLTARADFPVMAGVMYQYVPGVPGCDNLMGLPYPVAMGDACDDAFLSFSVTEGGTYYLLVAPQFTDTAVVCGTDDTYVVTLTGSNPVCGDLDEDGDVDHDDYVIFLDAFGGPVDGDPPEDAACDFDDSGAVGMADYAAWLQCYRDYIGDPFAGPPGNAPGPVWRSKRLGGSLQRSPERVPSP